MPSRRHPRHRNPGFVSASELAQMGVCERLVVFEHHHGNHPTQSQRIAIERGLRAHERFYRGAQASPRGAGPCFIATLLYGEGSETQVLRRFRDQVMRQWRAGRWLISVYYDTAPSICKLVARWSVGRIVARMMLRPVVWGANRWLRFVEARDGD